MPFIERGGLFIPADYPVGLGDSVFCLLDLPGASAPCAITGKVVWVNPRPQRGRRAGFGLQLDVPIPGLESCDKPAETGAQAAGEEPALLY